MTEPDDDSDEQIVGYGRPPRHSRFKPGQSGNPKGRAKGSRSFLAEIDRQLRQKVTITIDGKSVRVPVSEVIARRLAHDSMKGQSRAIELVAKLAQASLASEEAASGGSLEGLELDQDALRRIGKRIEKLIEE